MEIHQPVRHVKKEGEYFACTDFRKPGSQDDSAARPEFLPALAPPKMPHIPHGGGRKTKKGDGYVGSTT